MGELLEEKRFTLKGMSLVALVTFALTAAFSAGLAYASVQNRLAVMESKALEMEDKVAKIEAAIADLGAIRTNIDWLVRQQGGRPAQ